MRTIAALTFLSITAANLVNTAGYTESSSPSFLDEPRTFAFVDVEVIPMDRERVLENQTVVVREDRIVEVGSSEEVRVPEEAFRVVGSGRYLIPGLVEMHAHVPSPNAGEFLENVLFLWVANGVTTVRGMLGEPGQLDLRQRVNSGEILAPSMYLAGPPLSGRSVDSVEDAIETVRALERETWDFVKVLPGLTRAEYDAMAWTARQIGIPFIGHVPEEVGLVHALEAGQETFDHLDGYIRHLDGGDGPVDEEALGDIVRRTGEAGAWIVPTMALWEVIVGALDLETVTGYAELRYMPSERIARWTEFLRSRLAAPDFDPERARQIVDNRMRILEALHQGGVPILLGTDSPQVFSVPGFSLRREFRRMVEAGMTPYEILASGTKNAGSYLSEKDDFGTIAVGHRADLVLLEANPLDDILNVTRVAGVMVRGRWVSEREIQARLDDIATSYAGKARP